MRVVGIDCSERKALGLMLLKGEPAPQWRRSAFELNAAGVASLVGVLAEEGGPWVAILEEGTSLLEKALVEAGIEVFTVAPRTSKRLRPAVTGSITKDDAKDAKAIALSFLKHPENFSRSDLDEQRRGLAMAGRHAGAMEAQRIEAQLRLRSHLVQTQPALADLDLCHPVTLHVLAQAGAAPSRRELASLVRQARKAHPRCKASIDRFFEAFSDAFRLDGSEAEVAARVRRNLARCLQALIAVEADADSLEHAEAEKSGDFELVRSMPNVGPKLEARITSALAVASIDCRDPERAFAKAGVAPVTFQSGKVLVVQRRISCNPFLADAVFTWAMSAAGNLPWARDYVHKPGKRAPGYGRIRQLGRKLFRILMAILRSRTPYRAPLQTEVLAA